MADTSVEVLMKAIKGILKGADLSNLSTKKVRKMLGEKFDCDFTHRKKEIDKLVMMLITEEEEEEEEEEDKEEEDKEEDKDKDEEKDKESEDDKTNGVKGGSDADSEEEEVPKKKAKTTKGSGKRKSATKADDSEDPVMSSIKQMDDEDLAKKLQEEETGLRRRGARRAAAPAPKQKKHKEHDPDKKKKTSVYSRPCHLSDELAAIVGTHEMPRPEVVKTLWSIVKERNLQDPENKQFMLCDEQMETVFGQKRVRLFGMMKQLKRHMKDIQS